MIPGLQEDGSFIIDGVPPPSLVGGEEEYAFDPSKHPRHPRGSSEGGEFAPKEKLDAFLDELWNTTQGHPFDDRQRLMGNVGVDASPFSGMIHLSSIISYEKKGEGQGTAALQKLKDLADKHGVMLHGTAKAIPTAGAVNKKSLTTPQLKAWYKKHGFEISRGDEIKYFPKGGVKSFAEKSIDYKQIKRSLDALELRFARELAPAIEKAKEQLIEKLRKAGDDYAEQASDLSLPNKGALQKAVEDALRRAWDAGRGAARSEVQEAREYDFNPNQPRDDHGRWTLVGQSVVETEEFKEWFGDSKAVDENGKPLLLYRGQVWPGLLPKPNEHPEATGYFFTTDPSWAEGYAGSGHVEGGNILPVFLKMSNPARVPVNESVKWHYRYGEHDGIIRETRSGGKEYIVFSKDQIRSAIGMQKFAFDPDQPRDEFGKWVDLYHGTVHTAAKKIKEEGLKPNVERLYQQAMYLGERKDAVFVSTNLSDAKIWASSASMLTDGLPAIVKLRVPKDVYQRDFKVDQGDDMSRVEEGRYHIGALPKKYVVGVIRKTGNSEWVKNFVEGFGEDFVEVYCPIVISKGAQQDFAEFDPAKHPRHPAGSAEGGEFAPKRGQLGSALTEEQKAAYDDGVERISQFLRKHRIGHFESPMAAGGRATAAYIKIMDGVEGRLAAAGVSTVRDSAGNKPLESLVSEMEAVARGTVHGYAEWDASKHPRHPSGDERGGEFAPKAPTFWEKFPELGFRRLEKDDPLVYKTPTSQYPTFIRDGVRIAIGSGQSLGVHGNGVYYYDGTASELVLGALIVDPKVRGQGRATKAMRDLVAAVDASMPTDSGGRSYTMFLEPVPIKKEDPKMSKAQLAKFYKKFGFEQQVAGDDRVLLRTSPVKKLSEQHDYAAPSFTPTGAIQWLKQKAFWVTDILDDHLTTDIRRILINALKRGSLLDAILDEIEEAFAPYLLAGTQDELLPRHRLETVVRTNTTDAYNHGRLTEFIRPDMMLFLDGIRYSAILDSRTTEVCRFLHEKVFKPTDPALFELTPPRHYNCRSILVPIVVGEKIDPDDFITPDEVEEAKDLSAAGFEQRDFYDPDQPRVPKGSEDAGQWTAGGVGQHFSSAPMDKGGAAAWRKKMQKLYDTDKEFRAAVDAAMLFTQGEYNAIRAMAIHEITGELPGRYKESYLPEWIKNDLEMFGNPLAKYKKYFEGQPFVENGVESSATWRSGARALNDAIRTASPLSASIYRGVYGKENMEKLLALKPGDTLDLVGPTSFTADKDIATKFAFRQASGQGSKGLARGTKSAVVEVLPGAKGISVAALSPWNQKEVVSSGRFRIKEILPEKYDTYGGGWTYRNDVPRIVVEQVATFKNKGE